MLVFAGKNYYPSGGWCDFLCEVKNIEQAHQAIIDVVAGEWEYSSPDWYNIVENKKIIEQGNIQKPGGVVVLAEDIVLREF